jgi:hypothetical protein
MDANNISVAMELQPPTLPFFVAGFCLFSWQDSGGFARSDCIARDLIVD